MAPASGPVHESKMFPAAAMEDQEAIMAGEQPLTYISTPPFSSPEPETDGLKMEIVDSDTSAHDAGNAAAAKRGEADYDSLSPKELDALMEERDVSVEKGTGKGGNVLKSDKIAALRADDASEFKAADFKERINAATSQEELDQAAEFYTASGKEYASVAAAVEKKQEEINEASTGDEK